METFSALLATCAGKSPVTGEFLAQRSVPGSFNVFFGLRLNERFSKQSWGWWFETSSHPLWRHCNVGIDLSCKVCSVAWLPGHCCVVIGATKHLLTQVALLKARIDKIYDIARAQWCRHSKPNVIYNALGSTHTYTHQTLQISLCPKLNAIRAIAVISRLGGSNDTMLSRFS